MNLKQARAVLELAAKKCRMIKDEHLEKSRWVTEMGNVLLGFPQITAERCEVSILSIDDAEIDRVLKESEDGLEASPRRTETNLDRK